MRVKFEIKWSFEATLRPAIWDEYIGQAHIQKNSTIEITKRSRDTPKTTLRLLKKVRDFSDDKITPKTTEYSLNQVGVNKNGFDELDLKFLRLLCRRAKKSLGLFTISAALSADEETIADVIEPFLLANGYIERTARDIIPTKKTLR